MTSLHSGPPRSTRQYAGVTKVDIIESSQGAINGERTKMTLAEMLQELHDAHSAARSAINMRNMPLFHIEAKRYHEVGAKLFQLTGIEHRNRYAGMMS